jgi:cell shape-determining protein MreC
MGFFEGAAGILAIISVCIILPKTVLSFVSKNIALKKETELRKMEYQKAILELELEKQRNELKLLEEENKKYDRIINNS